MGGKPQAATAIEPERPRSKRDSIAAWAMVGLLHLAYALSFVDRLVIGLLAPAIRTSLRLGDVQIGWLMGPAFALFYVVAGLGLGWLIDHRRRTLILAAAIALWSSATMMCGFAQGFGTLFAARILVGVGEAAVAPAALSLIADLFPPRRRPLAVGVFAFGVSVGSSGAYILGGLLLQTFKHIGPVIVPGVGAAEPWRLVFLCVGAPGFLLAIAALIWPEAQRTSRDRGDRAALWAFVLRNRRLLASHFLGFGVFSTLSTAFGAWAPSFLIRERGLSMAAVGGAFGVLTLCAGLTGAAFGGWSAGALLRVRKDAALITVLIGMGMTVCPAVLAPLWASPGVCLALFGVAFLGVAFASGPSLAAILEIAPMELRGQAAALYYLTINLLGLSIGPIAVPLAASVLPSHSLGSAIAVTAGLVTLIGAAGVVLALRPFRRAVDNLALAQGGVSSADLAL